MNGYHRSFDGASQSLLVNDEQFYNFPGELEEEEYHSGSRDSPYPDEFESGSLTSEGAKLSILARAKAVEEQVE